MNIAAGKTLAKAIDWQTSGTGSILRGFAWSVGGSVASQGLALGGSVLWGRFLGAEGFGQLGILQAAVLAVSALAASSFGLTGTKYVAQTRNSDPRRAGKVILLTESAALALGIVLAAATATFASSAGGLLGGGPGIERRLVAVGLAFPPACLVAVQGGALAGMNDFRAIALSGIVRNATSLPLVLMGISAAGVDGAIAGVVLGYLAAAAYGYSLVRRGCSRLSIPMHREGALREAKILRDFSGPAFLTAAVSAPTSWWASAWLIAQPNGALHMGVFNAASHWRAAVQFLPANLSQPLLADFALRSEALAANRVFLSAAAVGSLAGVVAGLVCWAGPILALAYGSEYGELPRLLPPLLGATALSAFCGVLGNWLASVSRMWTACGLNAMWAAALIVASLYLVPSGGAVGLSLAHLGAYGAHAVLTTAVVWRLFARRRKS
jgi:O-antigen/teichoic acid export membrane protein